MAHGGGSQNQQQQQRIGLVLSFWVFQSVLSGTISSRNITVMHKRQGPQKFTCPTTGCIKILYQESQMVLIWKTYV